MSACLFGRKLGLSGHSTQRLLMTDIGQDPSVAMRRPKFAYGSRVAIHRLDVDMRLNPWV